MPNLFPLFLPCLTLAVSTFAADTSSTWEPLGRKAYTTSSFSENRGTRYHAGVDWSTEMEEGWPVLAPEDGSVERLRQSPFSYGKNLMFRGKTGRLYLVAHLSGFAAPLDSLMESEKFRKSANDIDLFPTGRATLFRKGDTLAFSGSTGIGNPHLHLEVRDSSGSVVLDPCENGIACGDTILPQAIGAAVWDASGKIPTLSLTSARSLQKGCLEVDPKMKDPRIALKLVDYSREPRENPMSLKEITLWNGKTKLYSKVYEKQIYGKMGRIREELLWSEEGNASGDWHILAKGIDTNENILASQMKLLSQKLKQGKSTSFDLEIRDFKNPSVHVAFSPRAKCGESGDTTLPEFVSFQDSTLFTFLSRAWIHTRTCTNGKMMRLLSQDGKVLQDSLCSALPINQAISVASLTSRWPKARVLEIKQDSLRIRKIHISSLPTKGKSPFQWNSDGVSIQLQAYSTTFPNALAWEQVTSVKDRDTTGKSAWVFHPKGLHLLGNVEICITASEGTDSLARLYWLGETSRAWFLFSKQSSKTDTSKMRSVCAAPDELRDLTLHIDTLPPILGIPRDTLGMIRGKAEPVVRIPVKETWAGIPHGNAISGTVEDKWIPVEFDSEPSEVVMERRFWKPGLKLKLTLTDELGNSVTELVPH